MAFPRPHVLPQTGPQVSQGPEGHVGVTRARCALRKRGFGSRLSREPRAVLVPLGFQRINKVVQKSTEQDV